MIPILYEKNETEFTSNGLGRLYDCISCIVTEERNGIYECDFEYPITGQHFDKIYPGRIIGCEHDYSDDVQPFDIVSYTRPINGIVTFHAVHISYRQSGIVVSGTNINSLSDALSLLASGQPSNPFSYWTDKTSTVYFAAADGVPHSVRMMLGGMDGSILDSYGGEFEFDKFNVKLWSARGEEKSLSIRYGVNLLNYNEEGDYSETYNSVIPYWTGNDDNGNTVVVKGNRVDSGAPLYNGRTDCVPLDLTDKFETKPTTFQLESLATTLMTTSNTNLPNRSISIDFVRLADTSEYKDFSALMDCRLCDSVRLIFPRYNVEGTFKIVKIVYNVLLEKYDSVELGNLSTSLASALGIQSVGTFESREGGGETGVDFVIEEGTSGGWKYRKWNSGVLEQFYRGNPGAYTVGTARGSLYSGGAITYTYPQPFISAPSVVCGATLSTTYYVIWAQESGLSATSIDVRIVSGASISQNTGYEIHIHAVGRWK